MAFSIVTGNGFLTNAQRSGDAWGDSGIFNNAFKFEAGHTYSFSMKYRSNGVMQIQSTSGNDLSPAEPVNTPIDTAAINMGNATSKSVASINGTTHAGYYLGFTVANTNYTNSFSYSITMPTSHPTTVNFTIGTGLSYTAGVVVRVTRNPFNFYQFTGTVISYDSGTGAISISSTWNQGTGTYSDWVILAEGGLWFEIDEVNLFQTS